jgi:hypothetical protein
MIDGEPVRKRARRRAGRRQRKDAAADREPRAERPVEVPAEHHLRAETLRRVVRPAVQHVPETRIDQPTAELDLDLVELDVVPVVEARLLPEPVLVGVR